MEEGWRESERDGFSLIPTFYLVRSDHLTELLQDS